MLLHVKVVNCHSGISARLWADAPLARARDRKGRHNSRIIAELFRECFSQEPRPALPIAFLACVIALLDSIQRIFDPGRFGLGPQVLKLRTP